ncbi:MAG: type III-B CRISPR module RAMP protein Cmr1 [Thermoplasmata archaeon]|nr:type III-B CRISPR module RAMP protein Cmr1 [Thermoplasmata archaeon]
MKVKIRTLTPIWTGGVEGKCERLHETGIIGCLHWWYEAIVRGLDGYAMITIGGEP